MTLARQLKLEIPCGTIFNGDFELGIDPNSTKFPGSADITESEVLPFSVDWIPFANNVIGSNGRDFVDLSGNVTAGGIKQTVCANNEQTYKLSFDLNVNPADGLGNGLD